MGKDFDFTLRDVIKDVKNVEDWHGGNSIARKYKGDFDAFVKTLSEEKDFDEIKELVLALLDKGHSGMFELSKHIFMSRKLINWKNRTDFIDELFETFKELALRTEEECDEIGAHYGDFSESFMSMLKRNKLLEQYLPKMFDLVKVTFTNEYSPMTGLAFDTLSLMPFTSPVGIQWAHELLARCIEFTKEYPDNKYMEKNGQLHWGCMLFILRCTMGGGGSVKINGVSTDYDASKPTGKLDVLLEFQREMLELFNISKEEEWRNSDDDMTVAGQTMATIMEDYLYPNNTHTPVLLPFMPLIKELRECGDETLERDANNIMEAVAGNPELMGDDKEAGVDLYLSGQSPSTITQFSAMYPKCPEIFHSRIGGFIERWRGADSWVTMSTINLFWEIAKLHPEVFTADHISSIVSVVRDEMAGTLVFMVLQALAPTRAKNLLPHDQTLMTAMAEKKDRMATGAGVLVDLAKQDKTRAATYLEFMKDACKDMQPMYVIGILNSMRNIGMLDTSLLQPHREFFETWKQEPQTADMARACIDVLEGRSLETLSHEVTGQKEDINELDKRVTGTEEGIEDLGQGLVATTLRVGAVEGEVNAQGERIDGLEEDVEVTKQKVEEIDRKTLSHAPTWSRDVARLMNEADAHDWRLMAARLGYTNDDIRNLATQPDPCLSLLDEWFATHKTREATYAISKILEEMNRLDAAAIVVQALDDTKDVVESDDEDEDFEPPAIFLSYQWGHQEEVKLLRRHLQMAGYTCWMDIGQMGGGDKLYAKLDQGIRAAKVIVSCVSEKYAQSPNCNREVNLSVTLGKPIIPLLMEKMAWPPPGTMGPIFSEYLFIRFFARPGEKADDDRYWPLPKFQELLMQLRFNVAPDHDLITEEYKNWWQPPEEIIVIKPREEKKSAGGAQQSEEATEASPDVFISYQWGKQPQIIALYKLLTSRGYSCWLDIMQMGGGDSLYDKIDRGVRGCKVVLSCVTSKYSLSANCRREVSLADAIKKPIVPLLLEKISWPPEGPMSMVFTQLLYINFCKPDASVQDHWQVPQFDELISKINVHAPPAIEYIEETEETPQEEDKPQAELAQEEDKSQEEEREEPQDEDENQQEEYTLQRETSYLQPPIVQPKSSCCVIM